MVTGNVSRGSPDSLGREPGDPLQSTPFLRTGLPLTARWLKSGHAGDTGRGPKERVCDTPRYPPHAAAQCGRGVGHPNTSYTCSPVPGAGGPCKNMLDARCCSPVGGGRGRGPAQPPQRIHLRVSASCRHPPWPILLIRHKPLLTYVLYLTTLHSCVVGVRQTHTHTHTHTQTHTHTHTS